MMYSVSTCMSSTTVSPMMSPNVSLLFKRNRSGNKDHAARDDLLSIIDAVEEIIAESSDEDYFSFDNSSSEIPVKDRQLTYVVPLFPLLSVVTPSFTQSTNHDGVDIHEEELLERVGAERNITRMARPIGTMISIEENLVILSQSDPSENEDYSSSQDASGG